MGNEPMRIAVVSDAVAPWHIGGKEARYREILRRIAGEGVEVQVYTMRWWGKSSVANHVGIMPKMDLYTKSGQRSMIQAIAFAAACVKLVFARADIIEADHMPGPQLLTLGVIARMRRIPLLWDRSKPHAQPAR